MNSHHLQSGAVLAALSLSTPCVLAQALNLDDRRSELSGHYIVGYATKSVAHSFNQSWLTPELSFVFATEDRNSIEDDYRGQPISGRGSYETGQRYTVGSDRIDLAGETSNTLGAAQSYVSAGARASSTLWLDFNVPATSAFSFSGELDATAGAPVGSAPAVATSTLILEQLAGSRRWAFDTPGPFAITGELPAGDWRLYGNAHTRANGDASFSGALVLSPVPEPACWALALAGLPLLLLRRRRLATAAAAILAAGPALAVPGAVNTLGQPEYYTTYRLLTPQGYGTFDIKSQDDAVNGTTAVFTTTGEMWDRQLANQQAVVTNNGVTYWTNAMGPTLPQPPELTTVTGAITTVDIFQSFQKVAADAELRFTYTGGLLQLFRDPELAPPCDEGCTFAEVFWRVSVTLNSAPAAPIMVESGRAAMGVFGGLYRFYNSQHASDGSPANPLWLWDCTNCDRTARNLAQATLQAPFSGIVDLSAVPFDAQQPVDFTVNYTLQTTAYVTQQRVGARAWARDPLGSADDGVSLAVQGLLPTNAPVGVVPEPASWALLLAGAALIAWRRRSTGER